MGESATAMPKDFARRLLVHVAAANKPASDDTSAAFRICEELRVPLGKMLGVEGFRSLLSRAQVLASADVPWLKAMVIEQDGSFTGVKERKMRLDARATVDGELALVGHLLGLLVVFIGPALTLRLLHEVWPDWTV
jgi:hypothetical protein